MHSDSFFTLPPPSLCTMAQVHLAVGNPGQIWQYLIPTPSIEDWKGKPAVLKYGLDTSNISIFQNAVEMQILRLPLPVHWIRTLGSCPAV